MRHRAGIHILFMNFRFDLPFILVMFSLYFVSAHGNRMNHIYLCCHKNHISVAYTVVL